MVFCAAPAPVSSSSGSQRGGESLFLLHDPELPWGVVSQLCLDVAWCMAGPQHLTALGQTLGKFLHPRFLKHNAYLTSQ